MKKILFTYISQPSFAGGQQNTYRLLKNLDKARFQPILLAQKVGAITERAKQAGIDVRIISFPSLIDVYEKRILRYPLTKKIFAGIQLLQYNTKVFSLIRKENIDLIWCGNLRLLLTIAPTIMWARLRGIPIIWNIWLAQKSVGWYKLLNSLGLKLASKIVVEYEDEEKEIFRKKQLDKYLSKFVAIYTGQDLDNFFNTTIKTRNRLRQELELLDDFVIGIVAAIEPRKGHHFFLQMARKIHKEFNNVKFLIVGDVLADDLNLHSNYYNSLKEMVQRFSLTDNVQFLGWRDDVAEILSCLDLFVLPSLKEGLPGAIREAMAAGKPVIGTDVGGIPKAVKDKDTGLIIPPGDVDALTNAVRFMIQHPKKASEMGIKGRERAKFFSMTSYIENYQRVFEELINIPE